MGLTMTVIQLDEFIVLEVCWMKEVIPAQKLSGDQLKNLSSFSVADAIRYFSERNLCDYGGIEDEIGECEKRAHHHVGFS